MNDFKYIKPYLIRYLPAYVFGILLLVAIDALQLITPLIIGHFTDTLMSGNLTAEKIPIYMIAVVGISVLVAAGRFGWRMTIITTAKKLEYNLRNQIFEHLEKLPLNYYNHHKTGDLMAHCTNDVNSVRMAFGSGIVMFIDAMFMGVMTILLMITRVNLNLTLLAILPLPLIAFFIIILGKQIRIRFQGVQEAFSDLTDNVQEAFSGIRIIKSFVMEKKTLAHFNEKSQGNFDTNMSLAKIFGFVHPLVAFISSTSTLIALIYGGSLVIDNVITIGEFVTFITYVGMLTWPTMALGFVYNVIQRGQVSLRRINVILATEPEIADADDLLDLYNFEPTIEVKNLTFAYPGTDEPVLKNISFSVKKGETVAIIGRTGSGKTTLMNLLLKLYNVDENTIFYDDKDIHKITVKALRDQIGYVPQDNFLFSKPIAYNIGFANESLNEDQVKAAATVSQIHKEIMDFQNAYETELGERGVNMSGGQKQRVSIARALYKKPPIVMLDDSLSAVDTKTEESILNHLKEELVGTTTLIVAHRISTIKDADQIIVLDQGEIAEKGTHETLMQVDSIYKDMYTKQLLEEKIAKES
ncbi:ABC transporter ATP-binding protein [Fusibacter sp. 3D3]|uniref:ABC transporter ATP-binding protein n=1 Tax=Fusibacter sp. 3D3 TaxID=1048380 RepID=UPI000853548D|nr:ABC transporter ATP-binding protein [Fusibacter sp. 3D3]GAU79573.1 ABC transporter, ATP-binding/permease protein [Fusibacter sp. 3D3]